MTLYNENDKRKIIMDYYLNPRNRVESFSDKSYKKIYLHSSQCVDEISLFYNLEKNDYKFIGSGCAIFLSSVEIFIKRVNEIGFEKVNQIIETYKKMIDKVQISQEEEKMLGELLIYENVAKHLNRKECALLITKVFEKIKIN